MHGNTRARRPPSRCHCLDVGVRPCRRGAEPGHRPPDERVDRRPGDCLRLEALALDDVFGPVSAQVTYRFAAPLVVKDEDGKETTTTRRPSPRQPGRCSTR